MSTVGPQAGSTTAPGARRRALHGLPRLTRAASSNFFYAFLTLPRGRREALFATYAFCRAVDDAVDEAPDAPTATARLGEWRLELERVFCGAPATPLGRQLVRAVEQFGLPKAFFGQVVEGVSWDLTPRRFATWTELARYCDLVAGAVGRLSVRIFGLSELRGDQYASALGAALQLTNILRDLGSDARRGRFYLPLEDLRRFGLSEAEALAGGPQRTTLLRFEAERARDFYRQAHDLGRGLRRRLCAAEVMAAVYRRLLDRIEARAFPVEGEVRLGRSLKAWLAATTWLRCRFNGA